MSWVAPASWPTAALAAILSVLSPCVRSEDAPPPAPRITALVPLAVPQGFAGVVRLRGVRLKEATAVRAEGAVQPMKLEIKEKKDAAAPSGTEASVAGDSEIIVDLALSAEAPAGPLSLVVAVGDTTAAPVVLTVIAPSAQAGAEDPGSGFQNARQIDPGQVVVGVIGAQHEVDVYSVTGQAGRRLRASVKARAVASLLDPLLSAYDAAGHLLATQDDADVDDRDAALVLTPAADGPVYFVIQDALDLGSDWHSYLLEVAVSP